MLPFGVIDTEILISADSSDDVEQFKVCISCVEKQINFLFLHFTIRDSR